MPPFVNKYSPRKGVSFPKLGTPKQYMELGKPQGAEMSRFCSQSPGSRLRLRKRRGCLHPSKPRALALGIVTALLQNLCSLLLYAVFRHCILTETMATRVGVEPTSLQRDYRFSGPGSIAACRPRHIGGELRTRPQTPSISQATARLAIGGLTI